MTTEFVCSHCKKWGLSPSKPGDCPLTATIGTKNRNHCPKCLYSLHLDKEISGDRAAECGGEMEPIGLAFKKEGVDKYGEKRQGEIMLIHRCQKCGKISINRIAADDEPDQILKTYNESKENIHLSAELKKEGIVLLDNEAESEIKKQLFGKLPPNIS